MTDNAPQLIIKGPLAEIVLDRPSKRNRIEVGDIDVLLAHFAAIDADNDVRVAVLRAKGHVFSAGFDLGRLGKDHDPDADDPFDRLTSGMENLRVPSIAAIGGSIYGGAADLALACDFRVGVVGMKLLIPAANIGLNYYGGGLRRFVGRLGLNASARIFLQAETLGDADLLNIGFLTHLTEPERLDATVAEMSDQFAHKAPLAVQGMRRVLNRAAAGDYDSALAKAMHTRGMQSRDLLEGLAAMAEKRPPQFEGR